MKNNYQIRSQFSPPMTGHFFWKATILGSLFFRRSTVDLLYVSRNIFTSPRFNSSQASDAMWRHRAGSILAHPQVMSCCLMAPSHYLNQCWLIIKGVLWQLRAILQELVVNLIFNMCWKITFFNYHISQGPMSLTIYSNQAWIGRRTGRAAFKSTILLIDSKTGRQGNSKPNKDIIRCKPWLQQKPIQASHNL